MQAIIMAGGKGTRLRPLTDTVPKLLLPLNNKTLLDYLIQHIKIYDVDNVIICTGKLGGKIEDYVQKKNYGLKLRLSREKTPLGTAGSLHLIKDKLEDEFFVLYGDVYTTINFKKMFEFHKKKNAEATLALHTSDHPQDSTIVQTDKESRIKSFVEKPGEKWEKFGNVTTTPLYIMKKEVISFIEKNMQVDFAKDVFPKMLLENKLVYGYTTDEYAKDMGTFERYKEVLGLAKSL